MANNNSEWFSNMLRSAGPAKPAKPLERVTIQDLAQAFDLSPIKLPVSLGEYEVTVEAIGHIHVEDDLTEISSEAAATLTFSESEPPNLPDVACLRGLTIFLAETTALGEFTGVVENEQGEMIEVEMMGKSGTAWVVEKSAILSSLWKNYGINVSSARGATYLSGMEHRMRWHNLRQMLLIRAFGESQVFSGGLTTVGLQDIPGREYYEMSQIVPLIAVLELTRMFHKPSDPAEL